jgi:hypothetical protein
MRPDQTGPSGSVCSRTAHPIWCLRIQIELLLAQTCRAGIPGSSPSIRNAEAVEALGDWLVYLLHPLVWYSVVITVVGCAC